MLWVLALEPNSENPPIPEVRAAILGAAQPEPFSGMIPKKR